MAKKEIICDTDVMVDYWKAANDRHLATKKIIEDVIGINNIVLSVITKMEIIVGAVSKTDLAKINKNVDSILIATLNDEIASVAINLLQKFSLSHSLSLPDSLIAATALVTDLRLFTYNVKHYKFIPELQLFAPGI